MRRVFVAIILLLAVCLFAQTPTTLQYKLEKDKIYTYDSKSQQKVTMEMGGQEMVTTGETHNKIALNLQKAEDTGDFTCIGQYVEKSTMVKNFRIDTTFVETESCGKKVEINFNKLGKAIKVTEIDSFPANRMTRMMGGMDPKLAFKRILFELPENPVKAGDAWSKTSTDTIAVGNSKIVFTATPEYKLVGEEEKLGYKCLKITFSGPIALEGRGNQMGADFFIEGSGKVEGTIFFAPTEGLSIYEESTTDQESTIAITGQQNMTMPQTTFTSSTISLVP